MPDQDGKIIAYLRSRNNGQLCVNLPNSYWSAYHDSQPVEITMDLNFVELRPIYYNDQALTPTSSVGY